MIAPQPANTSANAARPSAAARRREVRCAVHSEPRARRSAPRVGTRACARWRSSSRRQRIGTSLVVGRGSRRRRRGSRASERVSVELLRPDGAAARASRSWWAVRSARIASMPRARSGRWTRRSMASRIARDLLERSARPGRGCPSPRRSSARTGQASPAGERDRPVGVQLHLDGQLCAALSAGGRSRPPRIASTTLGQTPRGAAPGRPTRRGCPAGAWRSKNACGHLRAAGVVGADEQDVLHRIASLRRRSTSLSAYSPGRPAARDLARRRRRRRSRRARS